jgi:hypothetical protein
MKSINQFVWTVIVVSMSTLAIAQAEQPEKKPVPTKSPTEMIAEITSRWTGDFSNQRQVNANIARGEPAMPELTRDARKMSVVLLNAPQLGSTVLFFEEMRLANVEIAQRQRVVSLVFDEKEKKVRAQQYFFNAGPTYDRKPLDPLLVAAKPKSAFRHEDKCDLYFVWEEKHNRYRGSMQPKTCEYNQPPDGMVYADFEMLLMPSELWYRDRSIKLADGKIRGEIDGFSWLLFDKRDAAAAMASVARLVGVWKGTFRRFDADGKLTAEFSSEIIARVKSEGNIARYHQTNKYQLPDGKLQVIESIGEVRDGRIWFSNERVDGWSMEVADDPSRRMTILMMTMKDGSYVHEVISLSSDGQKRSRATQFLKDGNVIRRTLIDEVKVTDDWARYEKNEKNAAVVKTP